jgi:anti-sigma factor RsiW
MKKLLAIFLRGHRPDIDAISAYVDGRLDAAAARELEGHFETCAACSRELEGLRQVRSMLSSMGQAAPPRSFRLRAEQIASPERKPAGGFARGAMALAPAAAMAAVVAFAAVVAADIGTRDSGGGGNVRTAADSGMQAARAPAVENSTAFDSAGGAGADTTAGKGVADGGPGALAGSPDQSDTPATAGGAEPPDAFAPTEAARNGNVPAAAAQPSPASARDTDGVQALNATKSEDEGVRAGYLAAEILLGFAAVVTAGAVIYGWWRKRGVA